MWFRFLFPRFVLVVLGFQSPVAAALPDSLTPSQLEELRSGAQVLVLEEVAGNPWPRVRIYQKVNASPEEVAAVFFDYKHAKAYVPKVIKSEISRLVSPCIVDVDYGIDVPILPDEYYTARNTIKAERDGGYLASWFLIKALQTKASEGSLRIEKWNEGSLILYTNLVTPSSGMARLLKSIAIDQMRSTVRAIGTRVEKQKAERPEALQEEILCLQQALKNEVK